MTNELIINRETAASIAKAIRDGLNPTKQEEEFSGSEFADKIIEGQGYQYSQGQANAQVSTWNQLADNENIKLICGGGDSSQEVKDCPSIYSLKDFLKKDILIGGSYNLTYSHQLYIVENMIQPWGDWIEPKIGYYPSEVSACTQIQNPFNFFSGLLGDVNDDIRVNFNFTSNGKTYSSIIVVKDVEYTPTGGYTVLDVYYDDDWVYSYYESGQPESINDERQVICYDPNNIPVELRSFLEESSSHITTQVSIDETNEKGFTLTQQLHDYGNLYLYGESIEDQNGIYPQDHIYDNIMIKSNNITNTTFVKPFIGLKEATALLENLAK